MFVIAGSKSKLKKQGESKDNYRCSRCGYYGKYQYSTSRTYSTVFFVPIAPLPFTKGEYLHCPKCNYGVKLTKENREEYMAKIVLDGAAAEPEIQRTAPASQPYQQAEKPAEPVSYHMPKTAPASQPYQQAEKPAEPVTYHMPKAGGTPTNEARSANSAAEQYNREGQNYYNQGNLELAYDRFMKAMKADPNDPVYVYNVGETFRCNNDFENAKSYYERSGNMGYADGYSRIGYLYSPGTFASWTIQRVDDPNLAIYWFSKSIELLSENEKARIAPRLNNIAACYDRLNQPVKAAAYMWLAAQFGNESSYGDYNRFKTKVSAGAAAQIEQISSLAQLKNFLWNVSE